EYIMQRIAEGKLEEAELKIKQLTEKIDASQQVESGDYNTTLTALDDMLMSAKAERESPNEDSEKFSSATSLKDQYLSKAQKLDEIVDEKYNGDVGIGVFGDYYEDGDG